MGPCWARASADALTFHLEIEDRTIELTLHASARREEVMRAQVKEDFYALEVLVPWARAEATLEVRGQAPKKLAGHGYSDHSRSTTLPGKLADRWVRFRALREGDSRLVLVRFPPGGAAPVGWVWTEGKARVQVSRAQTQSKGPTREREWRALLDGEGGPWKLETSALLDRHAPIEEQGAVGALLGRALGNPVTYTYRGVLEEKGSSARVPGIFEVSLGNE